MCASNRRADLQAAVTDPNSNAWAELNARSIGHVALLSCVSVLVRPNQPAWSLSRVVVEQAKGFLQESLNVSVEEALQLLRTYARADGRHLTEVAPPIDEQAGSPLPNGGGDVRTGSRLTLPRAPCRLLDQPLGDSVELDVPGLADVGEPVEGLLSGATRPAADDADRLIDHRPAGQRAL